jgi:hypothetical protein
MHYHKKSINNERTLNFKYMEVWAMTYCITCTVLVKRKSVVNENKQTLQMACEQMGIYSEKH